MPSGASVLAFRWDLKCHFERRNPLFWHFKSNKGTKTKRKNDISDFSKCLHVFYLVFSIRCKICKICRSLALRQKVSVLMTAVFERFHAFHCLIRQSWAWGNNLFRYDDSLKCHDRKYNGKAIKSESLMSKCQITNVSWSKLSQKCQSLSKQ